MHLVDLGMIAKARPCVVVSIPKADSRRNMSVFAPLTTEMRHGEAEVHFEKPAWLLDKCAVNLIALLGVDNARVGRKIGQMPEPVMQKINEGLARLLNL